MYELRLEVVFGCGNSGLRGGRPRRALAVVRDRTTDAAGAVVVEDDEGLRRHNGYGSEALTFMDRFMGRVIFPYI